MRWDEPEPPKAKTVTRFFAPESGWTTPFRGARKMARLRGISQVAKRKCGSRFRRLPENGVPDWAGFWFVFKARQPTPSGLCNGWRNTEDGRKDYQDGISFDRKHLTPSSQALMCSSWRGILPHMDTLNFSKVLSKGTLIWTHPRRKAT